MLDDDNISPQKIKDTSSPRNLETLSVEELNAYLTFLESEIVRTHKEIEEKKGHHTAAASIFKS